MRIIKAEIEWMKGWGNHPRLIVNVDEIPKRADLIYHKKLLPQGTAYFAQHESGYVNFFYHDPMRETGYGGAIFTGTLEDGSRFSVRGPWSSNCQAMNQWFARSFEADLRERSNQCLMAGAITEAIAIRLIREAGAEVGWLTGHHGKEVDETYPDRLLVIKHSGMTIAESQVFKNK